MDSEPMADAPDLKMENNPQSPSSGASAPFPVVGVGASAGGVEAFSQLLTNLPLDTGMAFVLIPHLAPQHESMMAPVLSHTTKLPVVNVEEGMDVQANHIYLIPPNRHMTIAGTRLHLLPRPPQHGHPLPIDQFLISLAEDRKDTAIGVVLSGTSTDGTLGLKAIKAEDGFTFAQDESAKYDGMPKSAIAAGFVDYVLSPREIAQEIVRIGQRLKGTVAHPGADPNAPTLPEDGLEKIFLWLRSATGVDFSHYKKATIIRRIKRRMVLRNVENLADYVASLENNQAELGALYRDLLINVTSFFREPETFETLQREILPRLTLDRPPETPLRVWVPACSTGEEAYSLTICILEFLQDIKIPLGLQVFATDVSESALEKARAGKYTEAEVGEVSPERRERFFKRTEMGYQVNKSIRDLCVFAKQNLISDPPFSRLDLISCRNLLIYLDGSLQNKLIPIFHYALRPNGFLILGRSEGANDFPDLFTLVERKCRIFAKKPKAFESRAYSTLNEWSLHPRAGALTLPSSRDFDLQKEVTRTLLADYTPPGVVVNSDLEIVHFHGHTGPFLDPAAGIASLRLLKMAREGLPLELRTALHQAQTGNKTIVQGGIRVGSGSETREVSIEVRPLKPDPTNQRYYLVLFRQSPAPKVSPDAAPSGSETGRAHEIISLTQQLDQNKSELQDLIEQFALRNEELQTANEEIQSNNEELQSSNEELETAKEELQATNEELTTLNDELRMRNLELSISNSDLSNVISNVNIPILILGADLRIRRMNPSAESTLKLIPGDVGRRITDFRTLLDFPGLEKLVADSIASGDLKENEVQDPQGRWHSLRVRPYRTAENRTEGAVVTLVDITNVKAEAIGARGYAEAIVETVQEAVLVLDADLRVKAANRSFLEMFRLSPEKTVGVPLQEIDEGQWNNPRLIELIRKILPHETEAKDFQLESEFPKIGVRTLQLRAYRMKQDHSEPLTLLAINDVTVRQQALRAVEEQSRLVDLAHDAIIVRDTQSAVTLWNAGAETLYGWTKQQAVGRITHDLLKTKFPEPLGEVMRELMTQGDWSGELIHTARDGSRIVVASRQVLVRNEAGVPTAILEINRDITPYKQAEALLRSSEARLRAMVSSMDDVVLEVDEDGRCLSAWTSNPRFLPFLKDEAAPYGIQALLPTQSFAPLKEAFTRVIETGEAESVEYLLEFDRRKRWFLARINRIHSPESTGATLSVLVRETTLRKETEIALQQSEERFRLLVEGVKDYAIYGLDPQGYVVSWNSGAERIKGYARAEIIGKHFSIFYPPEEIAEGKPAKDLEIAASKGRHEDPADWRVRKDGSRFLANLLISATRDQTGVLRGFTKVTRDITDRKRAEDSIRQLSGHILRLQDDERRRIARDLHDSTAQILSALSMNLSLVGKRPSVAEDPHAKRLIAESESLAEQASDEVRSTSHLLHPPDLDTVGLVAAIRWYAIRFSERTGLAVKLSLPENTRRLPPDHEIALFRIMQESLTNAQRHSGSKRVQVRMVQNGEEVNLQIEDRGRGLPKGVLGMEENTVQHLGVGIAGMRERMSQLGGCLEIESSSGGTRVKATLPCPPAETAKQDSAKRNR
jgi:two-component system, chemotaxis family, CheB/CheR fusion protein